MYGSRYGKPAALTSAGNFLLDQTPAFDPTEAEPTEGGVSSP